MPRKKLLVQEARAGLDELRQHVLKELQAPPASSYREQFRARARKRAKTRRHSSAKPDSQPPTPHPSQ
jgi:hypothetical protein